MGRNGSRVSVLIGVFVHVKRRDMVHIDPKSVYHPGGECELRHGSHRKYSDKLATFVSGVNYSAHNIHSEGEIELRLIFDDLDAKIGVMVTRQIFSGNSASVGAGFTITKRDKARQVVLEGHEEDPFEKEHVQIFKHSEVISCTFIENMPDELYSDVRK